MSGPAFARMVETARSAVEGVHGEDVTIRPVDRAGGVNGRAVISASRAAYACTACFYESALGGSPVVAQPLLNSGERVMNRFPALSAAIRLSDATPLRAGDMIERSGGRWYEITEINPDGMGGAMVTLAQARAVPDA